MSVNSSEITHLIAAYENQDYNELSKNLTNLDSRIKFEEWLFNLSTSYPKENFWYIRVVDLICAKSNEDTNISSMNIEKEDDCLANLISRSNAPISKIINNSQIIFGLANYHPKTCTQILKKMADDPSFSFVEAFEHGLQQRNIPFLTTLANAIPNDFNSMIEQLIKKIT